MSEKQRKNIIRTTKRRFWNDSLIFSSSARKALLYSFISVCIFFSSCESKYQKEARLPDTGERGIIQISCDESFKPVIDQEVEVYESQHLGAKIIVHYKPESDCLRDFGNDSTRMVIATRGFTEAEKKMMVDSLNIS